MNSRSQIACELNFLEKFINSLKGQDLLTFMEQGEFHQQRLFELIFNDSMVYLDLSSEEIARSTNPYIKKLLHQQAVKPLLENTPKTTPTLLHLLNRDENYMEENHRIRGSWANNFDDKVKLGNLFVEKSYNFNSGNAFRNFDFLHKHHKHPHNAMIISDDYFFKNANSLEDATDNLKKLLVKILPSFLNVDFHLTFVTGNKAFDQKILEEYIGLIFKRYPFKVKLEILGSNFHKRILLTNYYYITTDKGFSLNTGTTHKNDYWVSTTFTSRAVKEAYNARVSELKDLFPESVNRLLS